MAQEIHAAMCCRGFTGEYQMEQKHQLNPADLFYIFLMFVCVALFAYLN